MDVLGPPHGTTTNTDNESKKYAKTRNATRTEIQPLKPTRKITKITNGQNTKRTYGQPSKQLFPKRWPLSNPNRTKTIRTHTWRNFTETLTPKQANENHNRTTALERSAMNYGGGGGGLSMLYGANLALSLRRSTKHFDGCSAHTITLYLTCIEKQQQINRILIL